MLLGAAVMLGMPARHGKCAVAPAQTDEEAWEAFRDRFILSDGRVVDTSNGGVSHTEGQGWGLLFAVAWDNRHTFDRILDWTGRPLCRPGDALYAWRYMPNAAVPVPDGNNATDGDLFIAWALASGLPAVAATRVGRACGHHRPQHPVVVASGD